MNPERILTWARGRVCRLLLAAVAVALIAPAAGALGPYQHSASHGNDFVRVIDGANSYAWNNPGAATAGLSQFLSTEVGGKRRNAFGVSAEAYYYDGTGKTRASVYLNDEEVLPQVYRPTFTLRDDFAVTQLAGTTTFSVGGHRYELRVTGDYDLDIDLAGRSFSLFDTEVSGQVRAEARLSVAMWLPYDVMIEGGVVGARNPTSRLVTASLPTHFDSLLTCDLGANNDGLGSWCRLQQEPWRLRIRLLRTVTLGRFTYTEVLPIVDERIARVDKYLLDKRVTVLPVYPIVR